MGISYGKKNRSGTKAKTTNRKKGMKGKMMAGPKHRKISGGLAALSYLVVIILAALTLMGCSYSNKFSKSLYVAEIRRNTTVGAPATSSMQFSIGYFGGCLTVATPGVEPVNQTHCIINMNSYDEDDLVEEFLEDMKLGPNINLETSPAGTFLSAILPVARNLQKDVFHWSLPVFHLVLFVIGGAMLFVASTNTIAKKSYTYMLVLAVLSTAFALALGFSMAIGSLQALRGLVDSKGSGSQGWTLDGNISLHSADRLYYLQVAQASMTSLFSVFMGVMFIGASGRPKYEAV